ncbi:signal transduction response regulator [Gottschalkia acidurici 9a]|uniref:Signal transduction response regulator n=2 Tax=Clostridium acidurici TaxID=1556 RepID=K0AZB8_GOTA9|nr:signal transduction response regulator [Gottschalkia acidurici 9a]
MKVGDIAMFKNKILIIEDEESICDILSYSLRKEGYFVKCVFNGRDGLKLIENFSPNLVILDLMLPDMSGFDICRKITVNYKIPIFMLTARNDIVDKVLGLELGADDYITKPFDIREVIARIKVILRRIESLKDYNDSETMYISSYIKIDRMSRTIYKDGEEVKLKPKEYDLLSFFCENKGRVFEREELLDSIWDIDFEGDIRTVDVHIQRLRKKLDKENSTSIIETVYGVGYKMN